MSKKRKHKAAAIPPLYFASGDLGSNKFHFQICDQYGKKVDHIGTIPALAEGMSDTPPFFKEENLEKAIKTLIEAAKMFQKYNIPPERVKCVGTAALRDMQKAIHAIKESGDEVAAAKAAEQYNRLCDAFAYKTFNHKTNEEKEIRYSIDIISEKEESDLVAKAGAKDLYKSSSNSMRSLTAEHPIITVAHCGGRSTEIINMVESGTVIAKSVLHFGVHTHKKEGLVSTSDLPPDIQLLDDELKEKWLIHEDDELNPKLLAVSGGAWRAIGKLICKEDPCVISRAKAEKILPFLAQQSPQYFEERGQEKRAANLATAANSLLQLLRNIGAEKIVFLQGKMVSVLTDELRQEYFTKQARESRQPASLLAL